MKLYFKFFSMHLRRQLQYRTSFFFVAFGQACVAATSLISIVFLMTPGIAVMGFNRNEVLLAGAIINLSYATAECFARGFDSLGGMIQSGEFDRAIVRPISEIRQIFMMTMEFTRIGRFLVALLTLGIVLSQLPAIPIWYLIFLILTGAFIYTCLFIIYGSICFYTTENLEFFNIVTDGTKEFGKAPFSFYGESILKFLTYVIPLALIQYYPLLYLLGKSQNIFYAFVPVFAYLFVIPTSFIWRKAHKHYGSTGS